MALYAWPGGYDPNLRFFGSLRSNSIYAGWTTRKNQKLLDKLITDQAREPDQEKRLVIINQIHELLRLEPSGSILFGLNQIYAYQDRIDYLWLPKNSYLFSLHRIKIVK